MEAVAEILDEFKLLQLIDLTDQILKSRSGKADVDRALKDLALDIQSIIFQGAR